MLMNKVYRLLLAVILTGFATSAIADGLSYSSVSVDYTKFSVKIEGVSDTFDGNGYSVDLSYAIRPHIAIIAGYSASNGEVNSADMRADADIDTTLLGFLIHVAINDTSDFIVGAGFINGKADVSVKGSAEGTVDADGGVTIVGFRTMALESLEINGFVRKNAIEDRSFFSISFGAGYYVHNSVSLDMGYQIDSEDGSDLLMLGVTKYF